MPVNKKQIRELAARDGISYQKALQRYVTEADQSRRSPHVREAESTPVDQVTLYLDIDGVLSPRTVPATWGGDWHVSPLDQLTLTASARLAEALVRTGAETVWLTPLQEEANSICPYLNWNERRWLPRPANSSPTWKLDALERHHVGGGPLLWADSELATIQRDAELLRRVAAIADERLLICPDPNIGLTEDHVKEIGAFVARTRAARSPDL